MQKFERLKAHADEITTHITLLASSRTRFLIACRLLDHACSVNEISQSIGMHQSSVSQHLSRLRAAGVVEAHRQHRQVFYSLSNGSVVAFLNALDLIFAEKDQETIRRLSGPTPRTDG